MTYDISKHIGVVSYQAENLHFSVFRVGIQGQKSLGFGTFVDGPGDDGQRPVTPEIRGIDLSESGLLVGGPADDVPGPVPEGFGDVLRVLEDVCRWEGGA